MIYVTYKYTRVPIIWEYMFLIDQENKNQSSFLKFESNL